MALAEVYGAEPYADHETMLAAERLDAVYLCVHAPIGTDALVVGRGAVAEAAAE